MHLFICTMWVEPCSYPCPWTRNGHYELRLGLRLHSFKTKVQPKTSLECIDISHKIFWVQQRCSELARLSECQTNIRQRVLLQPNKKIIYSCLSKQDDDANWKRGRRLDVNRNLIFIMRWPFFDADTFCGFLFLRSLCSVSSQETRRTQLLFYSYL